MQRYHVNVNSFKQLKQTEALTWNTKATGLIKNPLFVFRLRCYCYTISITQCFSIEKRKGQFIFICTEESTAINLTDYLYKELIFK